MSSSALTRAHSALSEISRGEDANEDNWMITWCNANWAGFLQPAPLSIAALGSLMVIASSTNDFSLVSEDNSTKFTHAKTPTSFKTCLQQMVGDGYTAFETASCQTTHIYNASSQLPGAIKNAASIILHNSSAVEVKHLLPRALDDILEHTHKCVAASQSCERGFALVCALAQEILERATCKFGSAEQDIERNEDRLSVLKKQDEQEKIMAQQAQETSNLMKKSFETAEEEFREAVDRIPSSWEIVGMCAVENLTNAVTAPINAMFGIAKVKSQLLQTGLSSAGGTTSLSGAALSDPGISLAQTVLGLVSDLNLLMTGGPGGKPDWDNIRIISNMSGGLYVEACLGKIMRRLDRAKPISSVLMPIMDQAVEVARSVNTVARTIKSNEDQVFNEHRPIVERMIEDLRELVTRCNLILGQPGSAATCPSTPKDVSISANFAQIALERAKFDVDQRRVLLEAARESCIKECSRLIKEQDEIKNTISTMTALSLENATFERTLPVLRRAVECFTTLRAQFSQLTQFFCNMSSLIEDVMKPQATSWVKNVEANSRMVLAGFTLSDWTRNAMYSQIMSPLRVSMLTEWISRTYLEVSRSYIMPAQREVGHMLQFREDRSEEGKWLFTQKLKQAQVAIEKKSKAASQKIHELVVKEQKEFLDTIDRRLNKILTTIRQSFPTPAEPVSPETMVVMGTHVELFHDREEAVDVAVPAYSVDELM